MPIMYDDCRHTDKNTIEVKKMCFHVAKNEEAEKNGQQQVKNGR